MYRFARGRRDRGGGREVAPSPFVRWRPARWEILGVVAFLLGLLAASGAEAGSSTVTVSAVLLSKSNCKFQTGAAALQFGTLDPGNPVDVTAVATLSFRCMGSAPLATYTVTDDDGLYETGPDANRMRHSAILSEFLPYRLDLTPSTATVPKGVFQTLTITGTVSGPDYRNARAGTYSDTVVITISP